MSDTKIVAPHPPLTDYYADETARHRWLRHIFDAAAPDYDRIERLMAFGTGPWYRRQALRRAGLTSGMQVLDVGTGTGLTAIQAARLSGGGEKVTGVDPSIGMLANAHLPEGMRVIEGRAEALPAADSSFDFISMGYALRHVADLRAMFGEFFRALRPGGRVCVLEITRPSGVHATRWLRLYLRYLVPIVASWVGRSRDTPQLMRYLWDSIEACVPPQEVLDEMRAAGFTNVSRHVVLGIFSEYVGSKSAEQPKGEM
jgi:demethylmenaquinone methyltransferase / 2-methoxy-6-polyprenyl-1,4-benzoquinol methylase